MTDTPTIARAVLDDHPDWRDDANCRGMSRTWDKASTGEQIDVCHHCPVRRPCLAYAYLHGSREVTHAGVWIDTPMDDDRWAELDASLGESHEPREPSAPSHEWTEDDDGTLRRLPVRQAAAKIGVTYHQAAWRRRALGITARQPWTPEEDAVVIAHTNRRAVELLDGRTVSAVTNRRHQLAKENRHGPQTAA